MLDFLSRIFKRYNNIYTQGIGIDLGLKEYATCSDGRTFKHFNKLYGIKEYEKQIQYMSKKKQDQAYKDLYNYRIGCIEKIVDEIVSTKPRYITIEDLHFSNMGKLQKALDDSLYPHFKYYLMQCCRSTGIELRMVKKTFPSSKLCSGCGYYKKNLQLSDRIYICPECGLRIDRDYNASLNLAQATNYIILVK